MKLSNLREVKYTLPRLEPWESIPRPRRGLNDAQLAAGSSKLSTLFFHNPQTESKS